MLLSLWGLSWGLGISQAYVYAETRVGTEVTDRMPITQASPLLSPCWQAPYTG